MFDRYKRSAEKKNKIIDMHINMMAIIQTAVCKIILCEMMLENNYT